MQKLNLGSDSGTTTRDVMTNRYDKEDSGGMNDLGQEFGQDLEQAKFNTIPKA
ncbi:MAG: hypothetical protein HQK56_10680 [Deltaproteobacteria bacterium]|nr:hypothetical protein [Deltaproteobacteria bacterium]